MRREFDNTGFIRKFTSLIGEYSVVDKDAATDSLSELPKRLKDLGLNRRTRQEVMNGFEKGVHDGNSVRVLNATSTITRILSPDSNPTKKR